MSMELHVLSDMRLASIDLWQKQLDTDGFALSLTTTTPMMHLKGALPVKLGSRPTSFECHHENAGELMSEHSQIDFGRRWIYAIGFWWGADIYASVSAYMAGASYAKATGGVLLDCETGQIITAERCAEIAREMERQAPQIEAAIAKMTAQFRP